VQRQVHALRRDVIGGGELEQLAQLLGGGVRLRAAHPEYVAAALDAHPEARFQQPQVLIERTAQVRQPRVVLLSESDLALWLGR
jgi:hypothetical protein